MAANSTSRLVLASTSRYRRELLGRLGLDFSCVPPELDERAAAGESPRALAVRLAREKAQAVAARADPGAVIIGSDQVADLDGKPLGKPGTFANALRQLQALRGRSAVFHTAVALYDARTDRIQLANVPTTVRFRTLHDDQLARYLELEEPYDCAGSAKVETLGIVLAERIESTDPTALVGLPLIALTGMLLGAGFSIF
jgi:septum formation protein